MLKQKYVVFITLFYSFSSIFKNVKVAVIDYLLPAMPSH